MWHVHKTRTMWHSSSPIARYILKKAQSVLPPFCHSAATGVHTPLTSHPCPSDVEGYPCVLAAAAQYVSSDSYWKVFFSIVMVLLVPCAKAHWVSNTNKEPTYSYLIYSFQLKHSVVKLYKLHPLSLPTWSVNKLTFRLQNPSSCARSCALLILDISLWIS